LQLHLPLPLLLSLLVSSAVILTLSVVEGEGSRGSRSSTARRPFPTKNLNRRRFSPTQRIVISTEAAHALCEQRSGEIRFST
jgi:hypothetical protein